MVTLSDIYSTKTTRDAIDRMADRLTQESSWFTHLKRAQQERERQAWLANKGGVSLGISYTIDYPGWPY